MGLNSPVSISAPHVKFVLQHVGDAELAAQKLTDEAFARGSSDNISCIVVQCVSVALLVLLYLP